MKTRNFDTIWREKFAPTIIDIPKEEYRDHIPCVRMIPLGAYDARVIAADEKLSTLFAKAIETINKAVASVPPQGIGIPTLQLIRQLPELLSHRESTLRVFSGRHVIKQIHLGPSLLDECRKLQTVMLERLLLFEDFGAAIPPSEVDRWADITSDKFKSLPHSFAQRAKLEILLQLVQAEPQERIVIFVRNVPVCEAIHELLSKRGIAASFAHGEVKEEERQTHLHRFKSGHARVLVVTRQLFGRGFDLPEADQAIFYSPKDSEKTMWQEMLRIRSTVRKPKICYVLFYAWTAEASKMGRLLTRVLTTGGVTKEFYVFWSFHEEEGEFAPVDTGRGGTEGAAVFEQQVGDQQMPGATAPEVTAKFVTHLFRSLSRVLKKRREVVLEWLNKTAAECGFLAVWPRNLVEMLLHELCATFQSLSASEPSNVKRILSRVFHPDKHPHAGPTERQFWHELFVALQI